MTRMTLSDQQLQELLAPPAEAQAPNGLLLDISDAVRRHPQVRPGFRWPWSRDLGSPLGVAPSGRLAWAAVVVGMIAILAAGAVIGARIVWRAPSERPPTGIETLTQGLGSYDRVVRDGRGQLWAIGMGHLARFQLHVGPGRSWTISDDPAFAAQLATAALDGGVWLWHGDVIRRFDGAAFRETVAAPPGGAAALMESPGGVLTAMTGDGITWRWDGSDWSQPADAGPPLGSPVLMIDADDAWVGEWQSGVDSYRGLWHRSGSAWTTYAPDDLPLLRGCCLTLAASPDGAIWAASGHQVARLTDGAWADVGDPGFDTVALGWDANGDGAMLAMSLDPDVGARLVGDRWVPIAPTPGPPVGEVIRMMSDRDGLFLGTTSGLYHLADGGWTAAWPGPADGPASQAVSYVWFGHQVLATGPDETWIAGNDGQLWHFVHGRWERPAQPSTWTHIRAIRRLADGSLALGTDAGVVVGEGDTWATVVPNNTWDLAVSNDGSLWAATDPGIVRHLVRGEDGWTADAVGPCSATARSMAVDRDGAIWLGGITYSGTGGIARFDAAGCQRVEPLGDRTWLEVMDIEAHPDGGVVIAVGRAVPQRGTSDTQPMWDWAVVRYDGATWTTLLTIEAGVGWNGDLAVGPDGSVWISRDGLRRYRDGEWKVIAADISTQAISVAPDGTIVFVGPSGLQRIRADALPD